MRDGSTTRDDPRGWRGYAIATAYGADAVANVAGGGQTRSGVTGELPIPSRVREILINLYRRPEAVMPDLGDGSRCGVFSQWHMMPLPSVKITSHTGSRGRTLLARSTFYRRHLPHTQF